MPDGVGAVLHHRLQLDVLERRLAHHRREERRQVALLAEDARDTADLLHEVHRSPEVERAQHALRDDRRSRPYIHIGSSSAPSGSAHVQLYGMYWSVAIALASGVPVMSWFVCIQSP